MTGRFVGASVALAVAMGGCGGRIQLEPGEMGGRGNFGGASPNAGRGGGGAPSQGGAPNQGGALPALGGAPTQGGSPSFGGVGQGGAPPTFGGSPFAGGAPWVSGGSGGTPGCPPCRGHEVGSCYWETCDPLLGKCVQATFDGVGCDDRDFCTVGETCLAGRCQGGAPNTCGFVPDGCSTVQCNPGGFCSGTSLPDGSACKSTDLCAQSGVCVRGSCLAQNYKDCSGVVPPGGCYAGQCNGSTGQCEAVPLFDVPCGTAGGLCGTQGWCWNGVCQATSVDCSWLDDDCNAGVCDPMNGGCFSQPKPFGTQCFSNSCVYSSYCANGSCQPGKPLVECIHGDGCCPANCTWANDSDCGGNVYTADAAFRGWWNSLGSHDPNNQNMFTGALDTVTYNSFPGVQSTKPSGAQGAERAAVPRARVLLRHGSVRADSRCGT
ncbi:MAG: hypothetical protein QM756_06630 [Polyangiaceae bacterium]